MQIGTILVSLCTFGSQWHTGELRSNPTNSFCLQKRVPSRTHCAASATDVLLLQPLYIHRPQGFRNKEGGQGLARRRKCVLAFALVILPTCPLSATCRRSGHSNFEAVRMPHPTLLNNILEAEAFCSTEIPRSRGRPGRVKTRKADARGL